MGIDMNEIEIKVGDKLIHRTTSKVIIVLGFIEKKNLKRQSKSVEVLHGRTEKIRLALWNIKKNYIPYEARLDTRLNAEIVTPVGSQWVVSNGDILKVYSINKHECTFDDVRFKLYTPSGVCIGGGSRSPESILDNYKPLNANRDFVGEFQKALTGETVSKPEPVSAQDNDLVNHPTHYTIDPSGIECIEVTRHRNFNVGNAIKYLWRAGLKDSDKEVQDLEKAIWYIKDEIKRLEGKSCQ